MQALTCSGTWTITGGNNGNQFDHWRCKDAGGSNQILEVQDILPSVLPSMSIADAEALGSAILLVWAIAWGARQVINLVQANHNRR